MEQANNDNRKEDRQTLFLNARCRKSSWVVNDVELANISPSGCCIARGGDGLEVGQEIGIRFADLKAVPGRVCWIEGQVAGVEFDEALDPELVDSLVEDFSFSAPNVTDIRQYLDRT